MPIFNPEYEDAPEPVAFDFTRWVKPDPKTKITKAMLAGEIPEPSPKMIREHMRRLLTVGDHLGIADIDDALDAVTLADRVKLTLDIPEEKWERFEKDVADSYATLCSDTPAAAVILKLPGPVRSGFFNYVQKMFMVPQLRAVGTKQSPTTGGDSTGPSSTGTA